MMKKGLATRTIVLILLGLIVLGIAGMLIFLGVGPFKEATSYDICKAKLMTFCTSGGNWAETGCAGKPFSGYKPFCTTGNCYEDGGCDDIPESVRDATINCCNYII